VRAHSLERFQHRLRDEGLPLEWPAALS
jgi:hypothetical protein